MQLAKGIHINHGHITHTESWPVYGDQLQALCECKSVLAIVVLDEDPIVYMGSKTCSRCGADFSVELISPFLTYAQAYKLSRLNV